MTAMAENLSMECNQLSKKYGYIPSFPASRTIPFFYIPQKRWPTSKPFPMLTCTLILPESSASKRLNKPRAFGQQKWWFPIGFPLPFEPERSQVPIPPCLGQISNFQWWNKLCLFVDVYAQVWRLHLWCVDANGVEVATIWRILQPWDICPAKNWGKGYKGDLWLNYHGKQSKTSPR